MERLAQLIGKLNEQFEQNADPTQLLVTTQLIESELMRLSTAPRKSLGTSKVAVMMPGTSRVYSAYAPVPVDAVVEEETEEKEEKQAVSRPVEKNGTVNGSAGATNTSNGSNNGSNGVNGSHTEEQAAWKFDPLREIPTLSHQESVKELNEVMASNEFSLNDKLKAEVKEVAHFLNDSPVRDLRRAIGINDRFVFISELFRGDEAMYERSIKTINNFRIFPEAEYWIERELKVKLGWDEGKEITRHFYQLVKRRFS
jgi:hypothetical protein